MREATSNPAKSGPIAVAMSGGVDSSVAAARLIGGGREVFGVTAVMLDGESRCCSSEDVERAARTASKLGMEHHVIDVRSAFGRLVLDPFAAGYLSGRTPSPCPICNREIKFGALFDAARKLGATAIATGHYARNEYGTQGHCRLFRGADPARDQSYFLSRLTQSHLEHAAFPLGNMTKADVMECARRLGLESAVNRESRELCFVTEGKHGDWIDLRYFDTPGAGDIEDSAGRKVGRHAGIHHYTIGQRKGLGLALGYPAYVAAIDAGRNVVVVGSRAEVMRERLRAEGLNWIGGAPPGESFRGEVQIRYNQAAAPAAMCLEGGDAIEVVFEEPQFAVTPGQLAVFCLGDEVLGSGWIAGEGGR